MPKITLYKRRENYTVKVNMGLSKLISTQISHLKTSLVKTKSAFASKPNFKGLKADTFIPQFSQEEITQAIREYQRGSYINNYLREGIPLNERSKKLYDTLRYAIQTSKPLEKDLIVYRGLSGEKTAEEYMNTNKGFTSLSVDKRLADCFAIGRDRKVLTGKLKAGTRCLVAGDERIIIDNAKFNFNVDKKANYNFEY